MWFLENAWLVPLIPAVSFVVVLLFGKRLPGQGAPVGIAAVGASFVLSLGAAYQWINRVQDAEGAEHGVEGALRALGQMQLEGYRVRRDPVGAMEYFYQAALAGDAPSMFILGRAFDKGIGVKTDQKLAAYWLGKAKAAGYNR